MQLGAQRDHLADDENRWRIDRDAALRDSSKSGFHHSFAPGGAIFHEGNRLCRVLSFANQAFGNVFTVFLAHQHDECVDTRVLCLIRAHEILDARR